MDLSALQKPIGPLPAWVWGVGLGGGLLVGLALRRSGGAATGSPADAVLSDDLPFDPTSMPTGTPALPLGGSVTPPPAGGGAGVPGSGQSDPVAGTPGGSGAGAITPPISLKRRPTGAPAKGSGSALGPGVPVIGAGGRTVGVAHAPVSESPRPPAKVVSINKQPAPGKVAVNVGDAVSTNLLAVRSAVTRAADSATAAKKTVSSGSGGTPAKAAAAAPKAITKKVAPGKYAA